MMRQKRHGFALVEMLIYIGVLVVFMLLVVNTILLMSSSYHKLVLARTIANSAIVSMERMTREIRTASSVDTVQSVLASNPGRLQLNTTDDNGVAHTVLFGLENGRINIYEDGSLSGSLTSTNASTTDLVFRLYSSGNRGAVSIFMTLTASRGLETRTESFEDTIELRNSL